MAVAREEAHPAQLEGHSDEPRVLLEAEPLAELAWERPRALRRLEARVRDVWAVDLRLDAA